MATKNDVVEMMQYLSIEFPDLVSGLECEQVQKKVDLWYGTMKCYDKETIMKAAEVVMSTCRSTPKLAHVAQQLKLLSSPVEKTDEEIWSELVERSRASFKRLSQLYIDVKAAMNEEQDEIRLHEEDREVIARKQAAAWDAGERRYKERLAEMKKEEFETLPEILKAYLATPARYSEVCCMDDDDLKYERSAFLRRIGDVREIMQRNSMRNS